MKPIKILLSPNNMLIALKRKRLSAGYKSNHLRIGYASSVYNTRLGQYNQLGDKVVLVNVFLDDMSYVNNHTTIKNARIGKFCSIGPGVRIGLGTHPLNMVSTHKAFYSNDPEFYTFADRTYVEEYRQTQIGHDVWVGASATILDGVNIGDGAVVAAGAVVSKNVEPYTVVGGVPAKPIKKRFSDEIIQKIQESAWWNLPLEYLKKHFKDFHNPADFLAALKGIDLD